MSVSVRGMDFPLKKVQIFNWLLLGVLVAVGGLVFSVAFAKGVLVGGLLANLSFIFLKNDLVKILAGTLGVAKVKFFIRYYARLAVLAVILFILVKFRLVHILGLLTGLSTVVLSIAVTAAGVAGKIFFAAKEAA